MANVPAKVVVPPEVVFGIFANAFRVVEEVGPDCFLDFIVYSGQEGQAQVVSRVRVRKSFLSALREKLEEAMEEFRELPPRHVH